MKKQNQHASRYYLLTLGCPKNTVDSEGMAMLLGEAGYHGTAVPEDADVLIVNTCGFLAAAEEESLAALRELADGKRQGQALIAAGCMAQRAGERIVREVPGVDGLLSTRRWMEIVPLVRGLRGGKEGRRFERYTLLGDPEHPLLDPTPRPPVLAGSAYLKISDGCNAPCAFCAIPGIKGKLRSRPQDAVVAEAQALVAGGAHEIILIAQDTTDYGRDLGQADGLPGLMQAILDGVPELRWLRLMYAYPGHVSQRLIDVMASDPRVCHYLDIPLQHGHPAVLRRMFRPSNVDKLLDTFAAMRTAMPDMAFRSTFIVGLPGETDAEFNGLLAFLEQIQFDKVGVFTFSPEPGTPAAEMPDQAPEAVKTGRYERAMALQQRISLARNQAQVGRVLDVLVEGNCVLSDGKGPVTLARSYRDAPEVDGLVVIPGELPVGGMARVRITGAMEYDLMGERVVKQRVTSNHYSLLNHSIVPVHHFAPGRVTPRTARQVRLMLTHDLRRAQLDEELRTQRQQHQVVDLAY
ncbi:MAG: 30S ribosomal protein S12 methylthiotransferase RimO [Chloroflexi bacterium HGW-Chloroflexi-1]|nr:MAG: 30S ribosomal protein S12 methylthiotransferase RimO [Chloroflexi bacterium HGW-Chloroflexi-1]